MPIRIIDNKKVDVTEDEWKMYETICQSYDNPPSQKGRDLFIDLFASDDNGIIVYLKPPHNRLCSFEVYLFLMSLMQHQHLRLLHKKMDEKLNDITKQVESKLSELEEKSKKGKSK